MAQPSLRNSEYEVVDHSLKSLYVAIQTIVDVLPSHVVYSIGRFGKHVGLTFDRI
jgi:hypothetical protein